MIFKHRIFLQGCALAVLGQLHVQKTLLFHANHNLCRAQSTRIPSSFLTAQPFKINICVFPLKYYIDDINSIYAKGLLRG